MRSGCTRESMQVAIFLCHRERAKFNLCDINPSKSKPCAALMPVPSSYLLLDAQAQRAVEAALPLPRARLEIADHEVGVVLLPEGRCRLHVYLMLVCALTGLIV